MARDNRLSRIEGKQDKMLALAIQTKAMLNGHLEDHHKANQRMLKYYFPISLAAVQVIGTLVTRYLFR